MNILEKKYGTTKSLRSNYFELGRSLLELKKYGLAQNAFLNAIKEEDSSPPDWELKYYLGECYEQQQRPIEAVKVYFEGVSIDADNGSFLFEKINDLVTNQSIATSILDWMEAHNDIWKNNYDEHFKQELQIARGKMQLLANNLEMSRESFNAIPDDAPVNLRIKALTGLGQIHLLNGDYPQAKTTLEDAISLEDAENKNPLLHLLEVEVLLALNKTEPAQTALDAIVTKLEISNMTPDQKIMSSGFYLRLCNWQRVIEITNTLKPEEYNQLAYKCRIGSLIALYRYEEAYELAGLGLQSFPLDKHIFYLKIQCLIEGQLDIKKGVTLFTEMYVGEYETQLITDVLNRSYNRRAEDANANFFLAFCYFLIKEDEQRIEEHLSKARGELKAGINDSEESTKKGTYPSKAINVLDGLILEDKGLMDKASAEFYDAGKKFYWESDYKNAIVYLKKTIDLDPDNPKVYWHLADALKITSSTRERPYNDPYLLEKAYKVWDSRPKDFAIEDPDDYWSYLVGSRIHELRNKFVEKDNLAEFWKALLLSERAVVHKKESDVAWTDLGKCYTNLGLYKNSYHALQKATNLNKEDAFTQEEYSRALLNLHKFDEAREVLNRLGVKGYGYASWYGFIDFMQGEYSKSIDHFNKHLQKFPEDIWCLGMKMNAHWVSLNFSKARELAGTINSYSDDKTIKGQEDSFINATFVLGDIKEAVKRMEVAVKKAGNPYYLNSLQSQLYLYDNQIEKAEQQFQNYLKTEFRDGALHYMMRQLEVIIKYSEEQGAVHHASLLKTINDKTEGWVARLQAKIKEPDLWELTPENELEIHLEHGGHKKGSPAWIALQAAMARLEWEAAHYMIAYHKYSELRLVKEKFTDADVALHSIIKDYVRVKDKEIKDQNFALVATELENCGIVTPEIRARLLIAYLGLNEIDKAKNQLAEFIDNDAKATHGQASFPFVSTVISITPNHKIAWTLFDLLSTNQEVLPELHLEKGAGLPHYEALYWKRFMGYTTTGSLLPALRPLAIEISPELSPNVPDAEWTVIQEDIKKLRTDFENKFGIKVPGIKIRANNSFRDMQFAVRMNEVTMYTGQVEKNMVFVPQNIDILKKHHIEHSTTTHPQTNAPAAWVPKSQEHQLTDLNLTFWNDPYQYIMVKFQYVLLGNLDYFFDIQYTYDYLISAKTKDPQLSEIVKRIIENNSLLVTFNQTLKGLLHERVPILESGKIIRNFIEKELDHNEVWEHIQNVRQELKESLPGNAPDLKQLVLTEAIEHRILENLDKINGITFLRIEPVHCQEILKEIAALIGTENTRVLVLIVNDPRLRFFAGKLVAMEHPDIVTLAKDEMI